MTPILTVEGLTHVYSAGTPLETTAISEVSLTIEQGELVGVIGHTGSGKSTFIQHLNGLLRPTAGRVLLSGADINASKASSRAARFRVGLVFQYPEYQLFEETIWKDIAFGPKNMGLDETEIDRRARAAAGFVGIPEALFEASPLELSGGQKRRVAIAGVIAMEPEVLILDEPTAGLDPAGRESILQNIRNWQRAAASTVLLVSHSMDEVARYATRLLVFDHGRLAMDGAPEQIFARAEELESMGLTVPTATKLASALRAHGVAVPAGIYTVEALADAVAALREVTPC